MVTAKHTKGPWRIGTPGPNGCYTVGTKQGIMVAVVAHSINEPDQVEQAEANAHLIAAAPELLEALQYIVGQCDVEFCDDDWVSFRTLIKKATVST